MPASFSMTAKAAARASSPRRATVVCFSLTVRSHARRSRSTARAHAVVRPPSVGCLFDPALATAFLARWRIDSAVRARWLHYMGESSPITRRTFLLGRTHRWPFHLVSPRRARVAGVVSSAASWCPRVWQHAKALTARAGDPDARHRGGRNVPFSSLPERDD